MLGIGEVTGADLIFLYKPVQGVVLVSTGVLRPEKQAAGMR